MDVIGKPRARELGLDLKGTTGTFNAITDVPGVAVGLRTVMEEHPRSGRTTPVRSGVTAVLPRFDAEEPQPVWAGMHRLNGNGEMTGSHWIEDGGYFLGPVLLTNTHSVGIAHHAAIKWMIERYGRIYKRDQLLWIMPVVGETYDGLLNDINGQHITEADVLAAIQSARSGPVAEGNTGGGAGMICYEFKGGTGTSSRLIDIAGARFTIGALVQANHGRRDWLTILGAPVGRHLRQGRIAGQLAERGSIIVIIATDLPLAPHQLKRVARRCSLGIARHGTPGGNNSGDIFLAFSVANSLPMPHKAPARFQIEMINDEIFDPIYEAVVDAVEEAVINALLAATDVGDERYDRFRIEAIPHDALVETLRRYGRLTQHS